MTESDKNRFDEIFKSDKYFENMTSVDFLRITIECNRLYEYIESEMEAERVLGIPHYMQYAYWLGVINERIQKGEP